MSASATDFEFFAAAAAKLCEAFSALWVFRQP
jgi:hypothetical protein